MNSFLKLFVSFAVISLLHSPLNADDQDSQEYTNPTNLESSENLALNATSLERQRRGYGQYPVVQCPGVKAKYVEFLGQLESIKNRIKSEACPSEEQEKINAEVENVMQLVAGPKRQEFTNIIRQGLGTEGEVTGEQAATVRSYVESIVSATAVVTGLTQNSACFDDDSQNMSLATLSSIISEVSGALGAVAGPMGAKITLGGQIAAGLIDSVGAIVAARDTYCTGWGGCTYTPAAEQAYVSTLCSYYQFKFDIDEITNPENRLLELSNLYRQTNYQLDMFAAECDECAEIINEFSSAIYETQDPNRENVTFVYESSIQTSAHGAAGPITISKPLFEYTYQELLDIFNEQIQDSADHYVVQRNRQLPTYYTVRSLRTNAWAEFELARVSRETYEDDADVALSQVRVEQNKIEEFLFEDEAPKFINFASRRAQESVRPFTQSVLHGYIQLREIEYAAQLLPDPNFDYGRPYSQDSEGRYHFSYPIDVPLIAGMVHDIFRADVEFLGNLTDTLDAEEMRRRRRKVTSYLDSLRFALMGELKAVKRKYAIFRDYCRLFEYGKLRYHGPVGRSCIEGHERTLSQLKNLFAELEKTILGVYAAEFEAGGWGEGTVLSDVNEPDPQYTRDWVSSLTLLIMEQIETAARDGLQRIEPELPATQPDPLEEVENNQTTVEEEDFQQEEESTTESVAGVEQQRPIENFIGPMQAE